MDTEYLESKLEFLAEQVHNAWMEEKWAQGFHAPKQCPNNEFKNNDPEERLKNYRFCDKCHPDLYTYDELSENIKEYDRVTVRAVLNAIKKLGD
jgi:ssDNA-binding Zn-finger/Zn-ribbon topoisomerase 1